MRKAVAVSLSAIVVGLLLASTGVSAGSLTTKVEDSTGDVGFGFDNQSEIKPVWGPNTPWVAVGYFDIASVSLSQKGKTYTYVMELASELPKEGSALPTGVQVAEWTMWIDPSPWNMATNPVAALYKMALMYDGSEYSAIVVDIGTMETVPCLSFSVDGSRLQLVFTAESIDNFAFSWWAPFVRIWQGPLGSAGFSFLDGIDWGTADGQVYYDLPWPPP